MTTIDVTTAPTPLGPMVIAVRADAVVAASWCDDPRGVLWRRFGEIPAHRERPDLGEISRAVAAYFAGDVTAVEAVAVEQSHGEFLDRALSVLRTVRAGAVVTYGELAALAGRPGAARAAGTACARNDAPLFVPCHRVVAAGNGLGGFGYGLAAKRWLLDHEAAVVSNRAPGRPRTPLERGVRAAV